MNKKVILVLVILGSLFVFRFAKASVVINEVQISPTEDRFIELYNSGSSAINLTNWYLQRKTQSGADFTSLVSKTNFENKTIDPGEYFLITRSVVSNADIVLGNLTLTESNTIQIKNENQEVVSKLGWGEASDCDGACAPNPTDGKSIQKTSSGWVSATPTPAESNSSSVTNESINDNEEENVVFEQKEKIIKNPTMKAKILTNPLAFTRQPTEFQTNILGYSNEKIVLGRLFWNFGDGSSQEQINKFEKISHTYWYPGEYVATLEYYASSFNKEPEAFNKVNIKVVPLVVSISKIGNEKDFFIELTNHSDYDADISGWILRADKKIFLFPRNSLILAGKKLVVPGGITGFSQKDDASVGLFSSTGTLVFDYYLGKKNSKPISSGSIQRERPKEINNSPESSISLGKSENRNQAETQDPNFLFASSAILGAGNSEGFSFKFLWIFILLLIVSGGIVYFIRQNRSNLEKGGDFDIIDE